MDNTLELYDLTKRYGAKTAVNHLSFALHGGVTGFLGPNGAGKTTTIRMILGLATPDEGTALIRGVPYQQLKRPANMVGALMGTDFADADLTARQHLSILCAATGVSEAHISDLLTQCGLHAVADTRIAQFSLGMKQRLGIAGALLGDPQILILDEPFNGLDVDGIGWLRDLLADQASQDKAVLVSSHLLSEVQAVADRIIVLAQGTLLADMSMEEMRQSSLRSYVRVSCSDNDRLQQALRTAGAEVKTLDHSALQVREMEPVEIGKLALAQSVALTDLSLIQPSLEELYRGLVVDRMDYSSESQREV